MSLKNGRDGKVGITEADYIRFKSMMASGASLKRVALLLDFANQKAQREAEARAMRAQQADQQGAQQLAMQKMQMEKDALFLKTQSELLITNAKGRNDILVKAVTEGIFSPIQALSMLGGVNIPQQQNVVPTAQNPQIKQEQPMPAGVVS